MGDQAATEIEGGEMIYAFLMFVYVWARFEIGPPEVINLDIVIFVLLALLQNKFQYGKKS